MKDWICGNCGGTGWTSYEIPVARTGNELYMRQRINPCHVCNASDWGKWAQKIATLGHRDNRSGKDPE